MRHVIRRYGQTAALHDGGTLRAFLQPLRYKNRLNLGGESLPLGYDCKTHYLCIAEADSTLQVGDGMVFDGADFTVVRRETIYSGDKPAYLWAILKRSTGSVRNA